MVERVTEIGDELAAWLLTCWVDVSNPGGAGRALLDGLTDLARADGLDFLHLSYRDGMGLGRFYESCGFSEVGRIPGAIRVAPGDDRDSVLMTHKL